MNDFFCLLPISFNLKIIPLISLYQISLFSYWKMYSRKDTSPNYIEISINQTRLGRFAWSQKFYKGKKYWTLFSTIQENWVRTTQKRQQVYLGEKEWQAFSAIRNTINLDAENRGLVPILELISDSNHYGPGACQLQQSVWHSNLQ